MKFPILIAVAAFLSLLASSARGQGEDKIRQDFRMWTRTEGDKTIEAKISDKKLDSSEVQFKMRNGKTYWVKTELLIPEDRELVKKWVMPVKHITCRVVGSGRGYKTVEVRAVAGHKPMTVKAYGALETRGAYADGWLPIIHEVAAGKELTFTYKAVPDYWVEGWSDKVIVDEERAGKKTGL